MPRASLRHGVYYIIYLLCQFCLAPNMFRGWMSECPESTKQLLQQPGLAISTFPHPPPLQPLKQLTVTSSLLCLLGKTFMQI